MKKLTLRVLSLLAIAGASSAFGQITFVSNTPTSNQVSISGTYSQNFDSLAATGTANTWTNNSTLPGWYSTVTTYRATAGTDTTGALYSFGSDANDRALGSQPSNATGAITYGAQFVNGTSIDIISFTVTYDGEQWRRGGNATQRAESLVFAYQIFSSGGGSINAASGWTTVSTLAFTSPNATTTTGGQLDGNAAGNRSASISGTIADILVSPGKELWIRWFDSNDSGTDHALAIDSLSLSVTTAVPEPSSFATLAGVGALGFCALRRRRAA